MSDRAVVIGAGVDELVAAQLLARAGRSVMVLESKLNQESLAGWMPPQVARSLGLDISYELPDPWQSVPLPQGGRLELWRDMARSVEAIARLSARDAIAWPEFCERMARAARLLEALYAAPPPDPLGAAPGDFLQMLSFAVRAHRAGRAVIEDLLRLVSMPVADLLDDWFESDALKGALGAQGILNLRHGPRAGGTAFAFLHHHVGNPAGVFRRPRSNVARILRGIAGVEVRNGAEAARILVGSGRVRGVALKGGEEIAAPLVISGAGPRHTLLELLEPGWLDIELARAVRHIRSRTVAARVRLKLNRAPGFESLAVAPSLDYLERASDDCKYGRISRQPYLEARSSGASSLEVHFQYAPREDGGIGEIAVQTLAQHCPELAGAIVRREVEVEEQQAELALDQLLWMRPVPALARFRTPVEGLCLCGPGMHPGPGILGASGYLCAQAALGS